MCGCIAAEENYLRIGMTRYRASLYSLFTVIFPYNPGFRAVMMVGVKR